MTKAFAATGSTSTCPAKPSSADVTYTWNPSSTMASHQFLGDVVVPYTYTLRDWTQTIGEPYTYSSSTTNQPFSAAYTYNNGGEITESIFLQKGSPATYDRYKYIYTYDNLRRLKTADFYEDTGSQNYTNVNKYDVKNLTYDLVGNLTGLDRYRDNATLIDDLTYTYTTGKNRLSTVTDAIAATTAETWDAESASLSYDDNGNLTRLDRTSASLTDLCLTKYDLRNLPQKARVGTGFNTDCTGGTGVTETFYRYNAQGQRVYKKTGTGAAEYYLHDGERLVAVFGPNGGVPSYWYVYGQGLVGRQPYNASREYLHRDDLGSVRTVVTANMGTGVGNLVEVYDKNYSSYEKNEQDSIILL